MKTALFLIPLFFILTLVQTSFLAHFAVAGFIFPAVFIAVSVLALLEPPASFGAVFGAVIGGVFLDAVSSHFFGYWTLILVLLSLMIRYIMRVYVRLPLLKKP